jgi:branched-chain amino acid transport system ATP-binding protein
MTDRPAVQVDDLSLQIGGAVIVDGVSFSVQPGELVTIIGPNGAGKTSLFNLLSGLHRPTRGRIEILGQDVTGDPPFRRAQRGLGRTFQTSSLFDQLTVLENVRLGCRAREGGSLRPWRRAGADGETIQRSRDALEALDLAAFADLPAGLLPHGTKRRLELAILLAGRFDVLLLDEPTSGLSAEHVPDMIDVIRRLHKEESRTLLMVEHRMDLVVGISDRIAVMHRGRLLTIDEPRRVMDNPAVQEAYLGTGAATA